MNATEKAAYLKGLLEGLDIDCSKPEGKMLSALVDAFGEIADEVSDLNAQTDHLYEYVDELDHDLGEPGRGADRAVRPEAHFPDEDQVPDPQLFPGPHDRADHLVPGPRP
jgi:hypothetical protein